ncbi:MAG TPA: hypothetical protein VMT70_01285 [Vicinamibacteria bacterium]|nr:hypothetical protein [Vicinamibacteria bacterium]
MKPSCRRAAAFLGAFVACLAAAGAGAEEPVSFFGGRLRLGGEVSGTIAPKDEGWFNYSDYELSTLRLFRLDLAAEARLASFAEVLFEARSDNLRAPEVYALYLRLRPWADRAVDLQAGLVPPVFGAFARRRYAYENPLPSLPLAYQYLTSLREDAVPSRAEELVALRGHGWLVRYPVGSPDSAPGLPLVNGEKWDAGLELRLGRQPLSLAVAVTQGTLSYPVVRDENGGKQVAGRLAWTPSPALEAGISAASGEFLSREVEDVLPPSARGTFRQKALGLDLQWSAGYWIVRGEAVWSRWNLPALDATRIEDPLDALGVYGEVRRKVRPGLFVAGRVERLGFSEIATVLGPTTWEAPVTRVEAGAGWTPTRHVVVKASWQHNWRDGGRVHENDLVAGQLVLWY